jgi:hypothetical protein
MARKSKEDPNEILADIPPRASRRIAAVGMTAVLGFLLLLIAGTRPPEDLEWLAFLVVFGAGCLWAAWRIWEASSRVIELTRVELREAGGRVLCAIEDVEKVDRGVFAFKPAGGFLVRLKHPHGRVYAPGLWWRFGRTLAVGGVTARSDAKQVADLMTVLLVKRDQG